MEAVLWLLRNGCRWRVLAAVQTDEALYTLLVDSPTVWTRQHASGTRK